MTPERGSAPVVEAEAQEKQQPEAWSDHLTLPYSGLQHISVAVAKALSPLLEGA